MNALDTFLIRIELFIEYLDLYKKAICTKSGWRIVGFAHTDHSEHKDDRTVSGSIMGFLAATVAFSIFLKEEIVTFQIRILRTIFHTGIWHKSVKIVIFSYLN